MTCATGDMIRRRHEFWQCVKEGIDILGDSETYLLDYEFIKAGNGYKEKNRDVLKEKKPYTETDSSHKKVYKKISRKGKKVKNRLDKYLKAEEPENVLLKYIIKNDKRYEKNLGKLEKLKKDSEGTRKDWQELQKAYEKCEIKESWLETKVEELDNLRPGRTRDFSEFTLDKFSVYGIRSDEGPTTFDHMIEGYGGLLDSLDSTKNVAETYKRYKSVMKINRREINKLNRGMRTINTEFRKQKGRVEGRSKTIGKHQDAVIEMYANKNGSEKVSGIRGRAEEREKDYFLGRWILGKSKKTLENSGRSLGTKVKNGLKNNIYEPIRNRTRRNTNR